MKNIGITTVTYFRPNSRVDEVRHSLTLRSLEEASNLEYPVIMIDGGSPDEFLREYEKRGANVEQLPGASFGDRTRLGISKAYERGHEVIMRLEIEKTPLISQIGRMIKPILDADAHFVVPHRGNLESYPEEQRCAERFGDTWFKALTGLEIELDMWGGTRVWRRDLSHYFLDESIDREYQGADGKPNNWACYFVPVVKIIKDIESRGWKIKSVPIDFEYPREQARLEQGDFSFVDKRLHQLKLITDALRAEWLKTHKLPGSANVTYSDKTSGAA